MADEIQKFLADPNGRTFRELKDIVEMAPGFDPASTADMQLEALMEDENYAAAFDLVAELMPTWMLSAHVHRLAAKASQELGDDEQATWHRYLSRACTRALLLAGDGSPEHPYPAVHVSDQYDLLRSLGKQREGQKLATGSAGLCDVVACTDGAEIWFEPPANLRSPRREENGHAE
jgi:hypothetical protein